MNNAPQHPIAIGDRSVYPYYSTFVEVSEQIAQILTAAEPLQRYALSHFNEQIRLNLSHEEVADRLDPDADIPKDFMELLEKFPKSYQASILALLAENLFGIEADIGGGIVND